jgi:predicted nucleic acid-binding protein
MTLIIDANRSGDFSAPTSNHAPEILRRISAKRITVVVGGHLLVELSKTPMRNLLVEWLRAGRALLINDSAVNASEADYASKPINSDDPHVLALAYVSKCRLLYTGDKMLMHDFKSPQYIIPRGKIVTPKISKRVAHSLFGKYGE